MYQHFLASWRACIRSNSIRAIAILAILLLLASYLASNFSGRAPQTITLDVGISGIRIIVLLMAVFWVQELLGREIDRRTVYFSLAYPVERVSYLLGRFFGIIAMSGVAIVVMGASLAGLVVLAGTHYHQAFPVNIYGLYFLNLLLIWLDIVCTISFVFLLSSLATSALLPMLLGLAFSVIARSYGSIIALLADQHGEAADLAPVFLPMIKLIAWIIPDLSRLDIRTAILYQAPFEWPTLIYCALSTIFYSMLALGISSHLFSRREFN
ncbi:ABC transporter permease subunit [Chitiniphilus shinanonensis]|uniref:ABC transporter permease subunit n=1 Tax=Chitiniphilus shinanonensis TaxID=553088 RepID=UPI0012FC1B45|nr:ABC transporter permease subunit [Chitiniphilus shinanonensis]